MRGVTGKHDGRMARHASLRRQSVATPSGAAYWQLIALQLDKHGPIRYDCTRSRQNCPHADAKVAFSSVAVGVRRLQTRDSQTGRPDW